MTEEEKRFPILMTSRYLETDPIVRDKWKGLPRDVKLSALNEKQAMKNHSQTLTRLAERGGLSPLEMMCNVARINLDGIRWKMITEEEKIEFIKSIS